MPGVTLPVAVTVAGRTSVATAKRCEATAQLQGRGRGNYKPMLARRFALPPINEAHYDPRGVPSADRQMTNSTILRPTREEWLAMLGELVQMCNECVRRKAQSRKDEVSATPRGLV